MWLPTAFIVLTSNKIKKTGPLFVYAGPYNELVECPLDKFYLRLQDAHRILSSIGLRDKICTDSEKIYATGTTNTS